MEDRKTVFHYIGNVFMIFGITVFILNVFCIVVGEECQGYSTMFSLGGEGLSCLTMFEFLLVAVCTVALRFLFFTDTIIKNMTLIARTVGMVAAEVLVVSVFIFLCGWFPVDEWKPWGMFFLSFAVCFVISAACAALNERMENRKMQEALERVKKREKDSTGQE
ncbi:MAG: hypothetical protein NC434_05870 [Ruminococcus sp.]|nr:hypothetical protein [Ruminococcus sp.]